MTVADQTMTPEQLKEILRLHGRWLRGEDGGTRANLAGANLMRADLAYANLAYANLAYANLAYANLTRANLMGANLAGANLTRADLAGANLAGANLTRADLAYANLAYANLAYANLAYANLTYANLTGANLTYAYLADAKGIADIFAVSRIGSRNGQTTFARLDDGSVYVWCGCFRGTLDEFAARVQETHGDNEHGRAYRMAIEMAKLRLMVATPAEGGGA